MSTLVLSSLNPVLIFVIFFLAVFLGLFLFFRAGRHELVDDEVIFDCTILAFLGALFAGRVLDFLMRYDFYGWSFKKLFFFNEYGGFDWYGALIGAILASVLYLRQKKINYWILFDLAAAPVIFSLILINLGDFSVYRQAEAFLYFAGFLIIFWLIKRLAKLKRHEGFFAAFTLISISILNLIAFTIKVDNYKIFDKIYYSFFMPAIFLIIGLFLFYKLTKRNIRADLKSIGALILLLFLKIKRSVTAVNEANFAAKAIIMSPLALAKLALDLVKLLSREIYLSIIELGNVFGVKK